MHAWEAIQKTLDIIEKRIGEDISTEELANEAALSLFYYQRLFSRLVKRPVHEYIKLRRLAKACEALKNENKRILDVALEFGFGSHEVFSRAFKDTYGITPSEYREGEIYLNSFDKPDLLLNYVMIDVGVPLISDGLVLEINKLTLEQAVNFMGIQCHTKIDGKFPNGEVTGVDDLGKLWQQFHQISNTIPAISNSRKIGVVYQGGAPQGHFTYFVGVETEYLDDYENFKVWTLPEGEYLVVGFEAETFDELVSTALNKALRYSLSWQKNKGLRFADFGAEIYYDENDQGVAYMEMWSLWLEEEKNG